MMDLNPALAAAEAKFRAADLAGLPRRSGAVLDAGELRVAYLGREYALSVPGLSWRGEVSLREKIIILHYLAGASGQPPAGRLVDFREMPGGHLYYSVFEGRVHRPFLKAFGRRPELLAGAVARLNGTRTEIGEFSFAVPVFPLLTFQVVLYPGDDELPASCKLFFDAGVAAALSTEDVVVVSEDVVRALARNAG